jgi:hypothetical protein
MSHNPVAIACLTLIGTFVAVLLVYLLSSGFNLKRIGLGMRSEWRTLRDAAFAEKISALLEPPAQIGTRHQPSAVPLRLLALLQRKGRLVDFLMEEIQPYEDAQIGAAVREIHQECQAALKEHLILEPVLASSEGEEVEIPVGFDAAAVRLTGNVTGQPPFRGMVKHHGWRAKELRLAPIPEGQDEWVLMPAEVELTYRQEQKL